MTNIQSNTAAPALVFFFDVDNTLLDNDRLKSDLATALEGEFGKAAADRFWQLYEEVRVQEDYVDYPTTAQRWIAETQEPEKAAALNQILGGIDFRSYVFPGVFETLRYVRSFGTVAILSDGDPVFQPRKINESGLAAAVDGNVLIFVHKETELASVFRQYPADHYVMVDDKPRILAVLERDCPTTFTTILVLQGKYGKTGEFSPAPDFVIEKIADLRGFTREQFLSGTTRPAASASNA